MAVCFGQRIPRRRYLGTLGLAMTAALVAALLPLAAAQAALEWSSVYWYLTYAMFLPGSALAGAHLLFGAAVLGWISRDRLTSAAAILGFAGSMGTPFLALALFSYRIPGIELSSIALAGLTMVADGLVFIGAMRARRVRG
ncbi:MAG: hypothetical protein E6K17_02460 [Methanobacteriota archaeon]|nr:MAG: hypothetical protein E6K17_02460 [Euryarchaeota archaeon]